MKINWQITKIGEYFDVTNGKTNTDDAVIDGQYPLFDRSVLIKKSNKYIFDKEALIIPGEGKEFLPRYFFGKFDLHQRAYAIFSKNNSGVNIKFLYHWMNYRKDYLIQSAVGSTVKSLRLYMINDFPLLLPPLETQQKIALILSTVDEEIQKTDQIIKKTDILFSGLMRNLLFGESNTKKTKIKEISEVTSSKRIMVSDYVASGVPFYRSTEIIKKSKNTPLGNLIYISSEKFNELKNKFGAPKKGDMLITSVGTIGDVYLVQNEEFYFKDGNLLWIRKINEDIIPEYLNIILSSQLYREKMNNIAGGSSQKALTIEKLGSIIISIPKISEQKRLINIFSSINNEQIKNKELLFKLKSLKNGLMSDIFNQKVEVRT